MSNWVDLENPREFNRPGASSRAFEIAEVTQAVDLELKHLLKTRAIEARSEMLFPKDGEFNLAVVYKNNITGMVDACLVGPISDRYIHVDKYRYEDYGGYDIFCSDRTIGDLVEFVSDANYFDLDDVMYICIFPAFEEYFQKDSSKEESGYTFVHTEAPDNMSIVYIEGIEAPIGMS
ncbi:hypothetical protein JW978_03110 [Candidatus Dojkabacteria bacterium]|nr:hypothetical protein [Candidatus Dojkabacteria bacterium]